MTSMIPSINEENDLPSKAIEDFEDTSSEGEGEKPWNPSKIRITTKNFSLREVVEQIKDGEIDLSPDFQRDYVWKSRQRTRLIESILLGIPLPAFYFNQDENGEYQVVDGVQRLSTVNLFMSDKHLLEATDLEYLVDLHGKKFSTLDTTSNRRFKSAQIVVHVIEPQTPDEVKYDIFSRVNTLGSPLSAQEIRHAMSKSRSRTFLKGLSELAAFDKATDMAFLQKDSVTGLFLRDTSRMMNRELALRFCAFRSFSIEEYRKHASLDSYLGEITRRLDGRDKDAAFSLADLEVFRLEFEQAMDNAHLILGKGAFRRWPLGPYRRGPINRAIFESQAVALADYQTERIKPKKDEIAQAFRGLFDDDDYLRAVSVSTGDVRRVALRLKRTQTVLREILE